MKRQKLASFADLPNLLFEDRFFVRSVDTSKFEKVGRIRGKSSGFDAEIILDVNVDIYPVHAKESLTIGITTSVANRSSAPDDLNVYELTDTSPQRHPSLMDSYDYVMYGKIFKLEEKASERRTIYASFGGLLMSLTADKQVVGELDLDRRIYLLIRKKQR